MLLVQLWRSTPPPTIGHNGAPHTPLRALREPLPPRRSTGVVLAHSLPCEVKVAVKGSCGFRFRPLERLPTYRVRRASPVAEQPIAGGQPAQVQGMHQ